VPHVDAQEQEQEQEQEQDLFTRAKAKFVKPTLDEVAAYCLERANGIDPETFIAHYESNGWKVGKAPMVDWKSAVVTFEKNRDKFANGKHRAGPGQSHDPNAKTKDPNHGRM
jgi:hypothetical protein